MSNHNIEIVDGLYKSFANGDWDRVVETLSDEIVWTQPGTTRLSRVYRGRHEVIEFFLDIAQYGLAVRPIEYFANGGQVLAVVDVELAGERANEVDRFEVRDGRIMAVEHIGDTEMLARALAQPEPVR